MFIKNTINPLNYENYEKIPVIHDGIRDSPVI